MSIEGLNDLIAELEGIAKGLIDTESIREAGAKALVADLRKLTKPISQIRKSGYTHMINTFSYKHDKNQTLVGWGKWYGPIVDSGSRRTRAQPHLSSTYERNKERYIRAMIKEAGF